MINDINEDNFLSRFVNSSQIDQFLGHKGVLCLRDYEVGCLVFCFVLPCFCFL